MKFRTEIESSPLKVQIDHKNRIFAIGSCFASNIAKELSSHKFLCTVNPTGVLFNPNSIANALRQFNKGEMLSSSDIINIGEMWFHYDFHTTFGDINQETALAKINNGLKAGTETLASADRMLITFGTAWVYEIEGRTIANCHKQPSSIFNRRRVSVAEIVDEYSELLGGIFADKEIIFTVSPVRHLGDGLEENFLSKATLKLAIAELVERYPNAHYFPAYEIIMDDLRDYRYYGDDLTHPSTQAIEYVWEIFSKKVLSPQTQAVLPRIIRILDAAKHRPSNPDSQAYKTFCNKQLREIKELSQFDFDDEITIFESAL